MHRKLRVNRGARTIDSHPMFEDGVIFKVSVKAKVVNLELTLVNMMFRAPCKNLDT